MSYKIFSFTVEEKTKDVILASHLLKLVLPETDGFLPSPPRPIELRSPELPDWVLFFGTDNIPVPEG